MSFFLLVIVLSVLPWFTASDYPFGIFKPFLPMSLNCPFFITPLVLYHVYAKKNYESCHKSRKWQHVYINKCAAIMKRINNVNGSKKSLKIPKGVIRIRKSKKNRQHNNQKKKVKRTNNDLQNNTYKTTLIICCTKHVWYNVVCHVCRYIMSRV